jgi:hypothetical protein
MGREYIYFDELEFPSKCPNCGGTKFRVLGARKLEFEAIYEVTEDGLNLKDDMNTDCEWEVVYGLECEKCGADLSGEVGL